MSDNLRLEALMDAIESQNLYHGRYGTVPAGSATARAILSCLRNHHHLELVPAADEALEGYWERAYWEVVPVLAEVIRGDGLRGVMKGLLGNRDSVRRWLDAEDLADSLAAAEGADSYASSDANDVAKHLRDEVRQALAHAHETPR